MLCNIAAASSTSTRDRARMPQVDATNGLRPQHGLAFLFKTERTRGAHDHKLSTRRRRATDTRVRRPDTVKTVVRLIRPRRSEMPPIVTPGAHSSRRLDDLTGGSCPRKRPHNCDPPGELGLHSSVRRCCELGACRERGRRLKHDHRTRRCGKRTSPGRFPRFREMRGFCRPARESLK